MFQAASSYKQALQPRAQRHAQHSHALFQGDSSQSSLPSCRLEIVMSGLFSVELSQHHQHLNRGFAFPVSFWPALVDFASKVFSIDRPVAVNRIRAPHLSHDHLRVNALLV
jgi:hypothetical protein